MAFPTQNALSFVGSIGGNRIRMSLWLRASLSILLQVLRSLTLGLEKHCIKIAVEPAKSTRVSLDSQLSVPTCDLSSLIGTNCSSLTSGVYHACLNNIRSCKNWRVNCSPSDFDWATCGMSWVLTVWLKGLRRVIHIFWRSKWTHFHITRCLAISIENVGILEWYPLSQPLQVLSLTMAVHKDRGHASYSRVDAG